MTYQNEREISKKKHLKSTAEKMGELIHYFKVEVTPTHGNKNISKLDFTKTETYSLQFTQIPELESYYNFKSISSYFDWVHFIGLGMVLILIFGSSTLKSSEELNAFYTHRLNPMMLTYFWGSLIVSIFFNILNTQQYIPNDGELKEEILRRQ